MKTLASLALLLLIACNDGSNASPDMLPMLDAGLMDSAARAAPDAAPARDLGADGAPQDAPIDGGGSATDGGATDGGATDGGATDGGSTDGGATDGGATDGGATDGGATDGGATDGGVPDIGPPRPTRYRGVPERPMARFETPATGLPVGTTRCNGTPDAPAFIVGEGQDGPETRIDRWIIEGSHCIVANVNLRGRIVYRGTGNFEVRDSQVHHSTGNGIQLSGESTAVVRSYVHHHTGNNRLGVLAVCGSRNVWVGENRLDTNGDDGFQSGHACGDGNRSDLIYFYGNSCRNNRENCVDTKWVNRIVISGNEMYDHRPAEDDARYTFDDGTMGGPYTSGSDGPAVVIGADGGTNTVFFFNNIYDNNHKCVRVEEAGDVWSSDEVCLNSNGGDGGYVFDKRGHTRLSNSTFDGVAYMLTTTWRDTIEVSVGGYTLLGGTEYRRGRSGTVRDFGEAEVNEADLESAFVDAMGFTP
ncbi:MAG: hypothetical protein AAF411_09815 [Myxococcota bacterium]